MIDLKRVAARTAIAGSLGLAALGLGVGVANAAPPTIGSGSGWSQDRGWDHGPHGPGWNGGHGWNGGGPNWGPPPPPPIYGYGGYDNYGPPCVTGPFGFLRFCP